MPFTTIIGTFHLVGRTKSGTASGFEPDGDSMQFKPVNPQLLDELERQGAKYRLTSIGSTQLRFEGIDALELHFDGLSQPRPLADQSRDFLTGKLGMNPVPYTPPENLRVKPPVAKDGTAGFILSRSLEVHGRPVSFAYTGPPPAVDGSNVRLDAPLLRRSLNFKSLAAGDAYPLFYDTLFGDLRDVLAKTAASARQQRKGLWGSDLSRTGLAVTTRDGLQHTAVVFPKLFRRLTEYLKTNAELTGFLPWLQASQEQVLDLATQNFTHLDNLLTVNGNTITLNRDPEQIVFISAKSTSAKANPWLSH